MGINQPSRIRNFSIAVGCACLMATGAVAMVDQQNRTIANGQQEKVVGTIQTRDGEILKVREESNSIVTVDLTDTTKVQLKSGLFNWGRKKMDITTLVPGLRVEAEGKGNDSGQLVANRVIFDPTAYKASRAIDTRVAPLEGRAGQLEGRAGQLEGRAGQLETKTGQLEDQQKQTDQQVAQVKTSADQANAGVDTVNKRVGSLDDYQVKYSATVYFKYKSAALSDDARKDLADLVQKTKDMKGYMVEVAGFTDTTGNQDRNEELSERRASAVVHYLQEDGDVPLRRILAPAGLGESHSAADNSTEQGRKMNRRVEVKILVSPAYNGGDSASLTNPAKPAF